MDKEDKLIQKVLYKYCVDKGLGLEAIQEGARVEITQMPFIRKWFWKDDLILTITHKVDTDMSFLVIIESKVDISEE